MPISITDCPLNGTRIRDYFEKSVIHAADNPLLHPTTLILVVKLSKGKKPSIILANKAPKVLRLPAGEKTDKIYYDCLGGHLEREDVRACLGSKRADTYIDLTEDMFLVAARRELSEELLLAHNAAYGDRLFFFRKLNYGPADMPEGGRNHEISNVYIYVLPDSVGDVHRDMILRDDYIRSGGDAEPEKIVCDFAVREFSVKELFEEHRLHPERFMDGIARILKLWDDAYALNEILGTCLNDAIKKKQTSVSHKCTDYADEDCRCKICSGEAHDVDKDCKCRKCGTVDHDLVDDSNGSGTGMVTEWCRRCRRFERYYDDTGTVIESTLREGYPYIGGGKSLDELTPRQK
ncbi:MAG: hypothetical protein LBD21_11220 [Tannerellaceae bacterium]|jgi:hypothetical protein|nr:hypothetical protein [Tannerellaceae bacterium]